MASEYQPDPVSGENAAGDERPAQAAVSELTLALRRLQQATVAAASRREHLPQPLFWSLFCTEIAKIKHRKAKQRRIKETFDTFLP